MGDADQPHVGERLHRLSDRRPTDPKALHQVALRWHGVAWGQFAAGDHRLEPVKHLVGELSANNKVTRHRHQSSESPKVGHVILYDDCTTPRHRAPR
jgi:hypothetical protein